MIERVPQLYNPLRDDLAMTYVGVSMIGALIETTIQPKMVALALEGVLLDQWSHLLQSLLNHTGNLTEGLMVLSTILIQEFAFTLLETILQEDSKKKEVIQGVKHFLPYFWITVLLFMILDAETIQLTRSIFGERLGVPDVYDIPAGLVGLLACALGYDYIDRNFLRS